MIKKTRILGFLMSAFMMCASMTACGKGTTKIETLSDLAGAKIAFVADSPAQSYAEGITSFRKSCSNGLEAVQALQNGEAEAVIMDKAPAQIYTAHNDDMRILEKPLQTESYVIAYMEGNDKMGKLLNDTLSELRGEGTVDDILSHWVGDSADHISYVPTTGETKGELIMATCANVPPFAETEGSAVVGIEPDIMRAICDRLGLSLTIKEVSSVDEIMNLISAGKADVGISRISVQKEYINKVSFTDSYFDSEQVVIVTKIERR